MHSDTPPVKILILAHDFPPLISIGALRPYSWYKYLPDFGADVTVVTRDWQHDTGVVDTGYTLPGNRRRIVKVSFSRGIKERLYATALASRFPGIRKAITYIFIYLEYLSLRLDSGSTIYHAADHLLQNEKFDFIIASGKPFILFRYASLLSGRHHVPWIADYRDSWTLNHIQSDYIHSPLNRVLNVFFTWMEKKYVPTARMIMTVAPPYADYIPVQAQTAPAGIVYNGYDDEIEEATAQIPVSHSKFIISYAGIIYPMQNLELFLQAVVLFLQEVQLTPAEFEINFWGIKGEAAVEARILGFSELLHPYVHFHSKVDYKQVMKNLSSSHMLLLLTTNADGWVNAKLFDYLVLRRTILMFGNQTNIMTRIIADTHAGIVTNDPREAARQITAHYERYRQAQPQPTVHYQQYSRKNQAGELYRLLLGLGKE